MLKKHFNIFFMLTNYYFVIFSAFNIVVLIKNFKTVVYMPKIEVGYARNG